VHRFVQGKPLLRQLKEQTLELDQLLRRALEVSASDPNIDPEDEGFPDSYLTLALYRLNTTLTHIVDLDESRYNLFHEYKLAPPCEPEHVIPGFRLAQVMTKAADLAAPGKTIGVGHYLRAIIALSLDEEPEPAWGFPGQVVHNTFSLETLLWGLGYTAWTPVPDAPEVANLLTALEGREPTEDFQYLMTVENGRLVLRPTSALDSYTIVDNSGKHAGGLGLLTHFKDQYAGVRPVEILELEELINNPLVKEPELQRFFEDHPHFFRMWDFRDVYPHVYLTREEEGPLVPDFILVNPEVHRATVIDLKLPSAKVVTRRPNRDRFTATVDEARAQLLEYRDWFEDKHNRQKLKDRFGMEVYRPRIGVVIGANREFRDALQRQKLASRYPDLEIVTYDDVLLHAQRRLLLINSAVR
jgi:hypothetical protein